VRPLVSQEGGGGCNMLVDEHKWCGDGNWKMMNSRKEASGDCACGSYMGKVLLQVQVLLVLGQQAEELEVGLSALHVGGR
jgi:hypothetical protein